MGYAFKTIVGHLRVHTAILSTIRLFRNVDCAVSEAFMNACTTNKSKVTVEIVRTDVLTAAMKFLREVKSDKPATLPSPVPYVTEVVFKDQREIEHTDKKSKIIMARQHISRPVTSPSMSPQEEAANTTM